MLCLEQGLRACSEAEAKQLMAQLMAQYQETTGVEKRRILSALGQSQYPSVLNTVLNFSLDGTIRKQDTYQAFACVCRNRKVDAAGVVERSTARCAGRTCAST